MKFVSLFTGIGGLDLGLERAGHECVLQVETNDYCQRVLAKHWPDVRRIPDIHDVTAEDCEGADLMVGGFPCQPVSVAGRRLGPDDERWLWPEFARLVRLVRPPYVLVENVPGLLTGRGMGEVLGDLAECGYDTEWDSIPAAAVGAPHLRYRVFIVGTKQRRPLADPDERHKSAGEAVRPGRDATGSGGSDVVAHANSDRRDDESEDEARAEGSPRGTALPPREQRQNSAQRLVAMADADSAPWSEPGRAGEAIHEPREVERPRRRSGVRAAALADPDGSRPQGRDERGERARELLARTRREAEQGIWCAEPDVGRVAHGIPKRVDRLRALGNSVVPQVAEYIGMRLTEALGARHDL